MDGIYLCSSGRGRDVAMGIAARVLEEAHDLPGVIDPVGKGRRRAWRIERGEGPPGGSKEAMGLVSRVPKVAHDLPSVVDPVGIGLRRTRRVDCSEGPPGGAQIAMGLAPRVCEAAHYLSATVDPDGFGEGRAGDIDRGKGAPGGTQIAMELAPRVREIPLAKAHLPIQSASGFRGVHRWITLVQIVTKERISFWTAAIVTAVAIEKGLALAAAAT